MERMKVKYVIDGKDYVTLPAYEILEDKYKQLEEENKKLRKEQGEYKKMFEVQLKDSYIKNTAEFLDKKFPKVNGFMEEDTLQELRDIGEI